MLHALCFFNNTLAIECIGCSDLHRPGKGVVLLFYIPQSSDNISDGTYNPQADS